MIIITLMMNGIWMKTYFKPGVKLGILMVVIVEMVVKRTLIVVMENVMVMKILIPALKIVVAVLMTA